MRRIFLFPTTQDRLKKKVTLVGIWVIALLMPLFMTRFELHIQILLPHTLYPYENKIYLLSLLVIISGLVVGSNIIRRIALLILYLSMFFSLVEYLEESMRIFEGSGCISIFKGYGIRYASLAYPQKILTFMGILFLIPLVHIFFIYILSNEESCQLYKTHRSICRKETIALFFLGITMTVFFSISLKNRLHVHEATKTYPHNFKKTILPTPKPANFQSYESLNLPNKPMVTYKVRFERNSTP